MWEEDLFPFALGVIFFIELNTKICRIQMGELPIGKTPKMILRSKVYYVDFYKWQNTNADFGNGAMKVSVTTTM